MQSEDLPELSLVHPMPGFPGLRRFVLVRLADDAEGADPAAEDEDDDAPLLFELRSLEQPEVRFLVGSPAAFFPDYEVELDQQATDDLRLVDAADAVVLVILSVGTEPGDTTANLLAPLVVNARNRTAAQVILTGSDWPVRAAVA